MWNVHFPYLYNSSSYLKSFSPLNMYNALYLYMRTHLMSCSCGSECGRWPHPSTGAWSAGQIRGKPFSRMLIVGRSVLHFVSGKTYPHVCIMWRVHPVHVSRVVRYYWKQLSDPITSCEMGLKTTERKYLLDCRFVDAAGANCPGCVT